MYRAALHRTAPPNSPSITRHRPHLSPAALHPVVTLSFESIHTRRPTVALHRPDDDDDDNNNNNDIVSVPPPAIPRRSSQPHFTEPQLLGSTATTPAADPK
ncbi:hypothetical protein CSUB01_05403 [Colletotrichum sublineola]|uniref:Uncharacterized protein n=1 Tax=Colletotrichum sublineola TaxID=1173701 RepID=A0A066XKB4_COLSU|nr:hypothetical protein CSUB01_05403 [Colletotrichum sublineola]